MNPSLTINLLCEEAGAFAQIESQIPEPFLYGVTDGKAIGTYFEQKFQKYLQERYSYRPGNSAKGIDFPELNVDVKVTRITQPQSSCPYQSARQKIYGLGYSLLVFVYDKLDDPKSQTGILNILHTLFIDAAHTADFQLTSKIRDIIQNQGNQDDIAALLMDAYLPVSEIQAFELAEEILQNPPAIGYLTISNALQWRLQYRRAIDLAGQVNGIRKIS